MEKEILQAIKNDNFYDFIANNYMKIEKEKMKDLILEIYYIFKYETTLEIEENFKQTNEKIIDYLIENRDWEN